MEGGGLGESKQIVHKTSYSWKKKINNENEFTSFQYKGLRLLNTKQ